MTVLSLPPTAQAMQARSNKLTPAQLELVWSMNRFLTRREFDQFIETSEALGLNPLKRQICALLLNRPGRQDRQVVIIATIAGLRAIADRTGTYRPDSQPARIILDRSAADPRTNPHGIVDCTVAMHRFAHGAWHEVVGQVWWDEIAPIQRDFEGLRYIEPSSPWMIRPRGQIIKCAEAAALRAGWPEDFSNIYVDDEMDRARLDLPSVSVERERVDRALEQVIPKNTILVDLWDGQGLRAISVGQFHDRVTEFIRKLLSEGRTEDLKCWDVQQRIAMRTFFAYDRAAGLDLKRQFEMLEVSEKADHNVE